jgi:hypothetical protein
MDALKNSHIESRIEIIKANQPNIYTVKLLLPFKTIFLGKIDTKDEGTFITSREEKHLFKKNLSLGINYELLTQTEVPFKWILIKFCGKFLKSTRNYFLTKGKAFAFGKKGYELQIFVPIIELNYQTAVKFEASQNIQPDLFAA